MNNCFSCSFASRLVYQYGGHFDFYCFGRHYGMLREQNNMYLPPNPLPLRHPILAIKNNRTQMAAVSVKRFRNSYVIQVHCATKSSCTLYY